MSPASAISPHSIFKLGGVAVTQGVERLDQRVIALVEARPPQTRLQRGIMLEDLLDEWLAITREQSAQILRRIARSAEAEVDDAADAPVMKEDVAGPKVAMNEAFVV